MSFFAKKTTIEESKIEKCEKKAPIWSHFAPSKSDKSKAICNHCGGVYSLGSDKPKNLTTLIPRKFAVPNSRISLTRGFVCCYFLQTHGLRLANSRFLRIFPPIFSKTASLRV